MSRSSSAVVDSKVVEMSLENSNFEKNATTTLSTLQKLKQALNFTTSKDGVDKFGDSLKKVNFDPINAGINTAKEGMSALDAVSFGFFSKIGGQIEQTAAKYASMFSGIKSATDGFAEYELKMGSVQTILMGAHTAEGLPVTLDMVNQKLDELNTYADKTIYSFSDMTANIGKFTNAGVDLDRAVKSIQGISNEAALAGANSQQASHAMYNFAQALSTGSVKLIDWKSIENANMATVEFKQTLIDTAVEVGTLTKQGDDYVSTTKDMNGHISEAFNAQKMFNDSLSSQWMTADVLTKALSKYSDETTDVGKKAFEAATQVKTFSQLMETLQEAMGSGWARTWELIVGDFDESKQLFTMLSDTFGSLIDAQADARNKLLEEGLGGKNTNAVSEEYFKNLEMGAIQSNKLRQALMEIGKANGVVFKSDDARGFFESLDSGWLTVDMLKDKMTELNETGIDSKGMSKSLDEINEAADRVIKGSFGNDMPDRIKQLNDEGFDGEKVQEYVNELYKLAGNSWNITDAIREQAAANVGLNESMESTSGLFDDILGKVDVKAGKMSGRELLFDALKTSLFALKTVLGSVRDGFRDIFPPATGDIVYKIAEGINLASKALRRFSLKNADNIRTVFRGVASALDLVLRVGKAVIGSVFKAIGKAFNSTSGPAGNFIVKIFDLVTQFRNWVVENELIEKSIKRIEDVISSVISTVGSWINAFMDIPQVQQVVEAFGNAFDYVKDNFSAVTEKAGKSLKKFGFNVGKALDAKTPEEYITRIKRAFSVLWTDISSSETMQKIKNAFGQVGESIKSYINDLGSNDDGTRNTFGKIIDSVIDFKDRVKSVLSGFDKNGEKIGFFSGIGNAFTNLWKDISQSGVVEKIKDNLKAVWNTVNSFFKTLGTNADGSKNLFGHVWEGISSGLTWVYDKAVAAKEAIHNFFEEYKLAEFFSNIWSNVSTGFSDFFGKLPDFFSGAKTAFGDFFDRVKDLGGFKFSNLGDIWKSLKDTVGDFFGNTDVFSPIIDAFDKVKQEVKAKLEEFGVNFDIIKEKIKNVVDSIKESWNDLTSEGPLKALSNLFGGEEIQGAEKKVSKAAKGLKKSGKGIAAVFKELKKNFANSTLGKIAVSIGGFLGRIGKAVLKVKPDTIFGILKAIVAFKIVKGVWSEIKGFIKQFADSITGLWDSMAAKNKAKANLINKAAILELAAAIGIVGLVIKELASIDDMGKAWQALGIMGAVLAGLAVVSVLLSKISKNAGGDMLTIGKSMILMGVAISAVGLVIKELASIDDMGKAWQALGMLSIILGAMSAVMILGAKFGGPMSAAFGTGMLAMAGAMVLATIALKIFESVDFAGCVQKLIDAVKLWYEKLDEVPDVSGAQSDKSGALLFTLEGISIVLGSAAIAGFLVTIGDFVSSITGGSGSVLDTFGDGVEKLVDAVKTWNAKVNEIPLSAGTYFKGMLLMAQLAQIELVLGAAVIEGFIDAVFSFVNEKMGQDPPLDKFAEGIGKLLNAVRSWNTRVGSLKFDAGVYAKSLLLLSLLGNIILVIGGATISSFINSIFDFVNGIMGGKESLMAKFATDVDILVQAVTDFQDGTKDVKAGEVNEMTQAIDNIADVVDHVNSSSFWESVTEFFTHTDAVTEFKTKAKDLSTAISNFTSGFKSTNPGEVEQATKIISALSKLGSVMQYFIADTGSAGNGFSNLENFGRMLGDADSGLGRNLANFVANCPNAGTLTTITTNFRSLITATQILGELNLTDGDFYDEGKLEKLRSNVSKLTGVAYAASGAGLLSAGVTLFRSAIESFSTINLSGGEIYDSGIVTKVMENVSKLSTMISGLTTLDTSGVEKLTGSIAKINAAKLSDAAKNIDTAKTAQAGKDTGKAMSDSIASGINSSDIKSAVSTAVSSSLKGVNTSGYRNLGISLGTYLASGILKARSSMKSSADTVVKSAISGISSYKSSFVDAGENFTAGLASGILRNQSSAINAAIRVASEAIAAAKRKLNEHSPSKVTEEIGMFFDLGLAKGIDKYAHTVSSASEDVAGYAIDGLRAAIDGTADILNGDGLNEPVITPILDLSNVENGASAIGSMLSNNQNILAGNFGSISANADAMRQRTSNLDILNALEALGSNLGNVSGDTYIIDGVTYDDGSNVSGAVRDLIRAAKIERRA